LQLTGLDSKDVGVLDSLNTFEADTPTEELDRAGLPTYDVNRTQPQDNIMGVFQGP